MNYDELKSRFIKSVYSKLSPGSSLSSEVQIKKSGISLYIEIPAINLDRAELGLIDAFFKQNGFSRDGSPTEVKNPFGNRTNYSIIEYVPNQTLENKMKPTTEEKIRKIIRRKLKEETSLPVDAPLLENALINTIFRVLKGRVPSGDATILSYDIAEELLNTYRISEM